MLTYVSFLSFLQKSKSKKLFEEDGVEEGQDEVDRSKSATTVKRERKSKVGKKHKKQEAQINAEGAPFVQSNENGSLLQSGIRAHPTRKPYAFVMDILFCSILT